jgi:solute carrier family 25 carnitine/acylcarnitine transporter 20/29
VKEGLQGTAGESKAGGLVPANLVPAVAGGVAGSMVWVPPFYSIDVIKTRLQSAPAGTYSGFVDCVKKSVDKEGAGVFVRGMGLAQARAFLVHGSIFFL